MAGNTLGPRSYYGYVNDAGTTYSLLLDDTLALAAGLTLNDGGLTPPRRFKPRVVLLKGNTGGVPVTKRLTVNVDNPAYASDTSTDITIDGVTFTASGRVGEKLSFAGN